MPKKRSVRKKALYWWNEQIAETRRRAGRIKRQLTKMKRRGREEEAIVLRENLREIKREMKALIRDAKEKAWTEFVDTLNKDPWARPYKLVMGRLKPWTPPITETLEPEAVERIVAELFPGDDDLPPRRYELPAPWRENWQMKEEEMVWVVKRIGGVAKAPGPDRIPGAAKMAIPHVGEDIRELMEGCLREGHFPEIWKKATLVLIPKEGKPAGLPSSYKPICLIDESAKVFERVIADRIGK